MLRYQLAYFGYEVARDIHDCFRGCNASFILGGSLFVGLSFVVIQNSPNFFLVPAFWKLSVFHCCFFFLRLR